MSLTLSKKLKRIDDYHYAIKCPGCRDYHKINLLEYRWNSSADYPSFSPSFKLEGCHFTILNGTIIYYQDCSHSFAGKTIPLLDFTKDKT